LIALTEIFKTGRLGIVLNRLLLRRNGGAGKFADASESNPTETCYKHALSTPYRCWATSKLGIPDSRYCSDFNFDVVEPRFQFTTQIDDDSTFSSRLPLEMSYLLLKRGSYYHQRHREVVKNQSEQVTVSIASKQLVHPFTRSTRMTYPVDGYCQFR